MSSHGASGRGNGGRDFILEQRPVALEIGEDGRFGRLLQRLDAINAPVDLLVGGGEVAEEPPSEEEEE